MINRGKKNIYFELFTKAVICAAIFYFTVGLIWQMVKGWFV